MRNDHFQQKPEKPSVPEIFTNKQSVQTDYVQQLPTRRSTTAFDHTKYSLGQLTNSPMDVELERSQPPTLIASVPRAPERVIMERGKFPFAKGATALRVVGPLQASSSLLASPSSATANSSGKVIVLKYSKGRVAPGKVTSSDVTPQYSPTASTLQYSNKTVQYANSSTLPSSPARLTVTASGLQLRQARPVVRCIACYRAIGANQMTAKKCPKCDQWCHHICSHLCID